jgi:hypothetical protein
VGATRSISILSVGSIVTEIPTSANNASWGTMKKSLCSSSISLC